MNIEDIKQLTETLKEEAQELEKAYNDKQLDNFRKVVREMLTINDRILKQIN